MAGRLVRAASALVTADSTANGYLTVGNNAAFYIGAQANISNNGGLSDRVVITELGLNGTPDTTHIGVRIINPLPAAVGSQFASGSNTPPPGPSYGRSNVSQYTLATVSRIDMESQLIYMPNDPGATPSF